MAMNLKVKSNGDDDILAIRNINPQELVRYRDLKNQGRQHRHDWNLQCQIRQESCSIVFDETQRTCSSKEYKCQ
jgi:hypothetical protein